MNITLNKQQQQQQQQPKITISTRSRKRNRNKNANVTTVALVGSNSNPVRRKRVRRQRNNRALVPYNRSYWDRYFTHNDPTMVDSVQKLVQTQFYPQHGIHRSVSNGFENSAICFYQGSFEATLGGSNNVATFAAYPALFAGDAYTTVVGVPFIGWKAAPDILDPTGVGTGKIAGPFFTTNPATLGRTVSFTMNIIPASTALNRGGEGKLAYAPDVPTFSRTAIDNYAISRSWDGVDSMTMHWTPGVAEYDYNAGVYAASTTAAGLQQSQLSALVGYIAAPPNTPMIFRIEWQVGIEYIPTAAYKPLVDRKAPTVRPDARYFLNQVVRNNWTPLLISSFESYQKRLAISNSLGGHTEMGYVDHAGFGGIGFTNPANADIESDWVEMNEQPGFVRSAINSMTRGACEYMPQGFCEDPMGTAGRYVGRAAITGAMEYGRNRLMNRQQYPMIRN